MSAQGTVTLRDVTKSDLPVFFEFERDPVANEMAAFPARDRDAFMQHWTANILGNDTGRKRTVLLDGEVVGNMLSWEQPETRSSATGSGASTGGGASRPARSRCS